MQDKRSLNVDVPEYQLEIYDEEAERMGFGSRAAFIRAMINAGRRDFGLDPQGTGDEDTTLDDLIEQRILTHLRQTGSLPTDEIVDGVTDEVEQSTTAALERLNDAGDIDYSVQDGGFVLSR
ncbi:DUF5805 domain-containing protein [Saliphagus sp. GCM10025334]